MKRHEAFPSRFLSKEEVETPIVATIAAVKMETFKGDDGDESKPALYFNGNTKPCLLNNANWLTCEDLYGPESDEWLGKQIEIYKDPNVMFGKKRVGGVRLRQPSNGNNGHGPAPVAAAAKLPFDAWIEAQTPQTWKDFCHSVGATQEHVVEALGENSVKNWLASDPSRTPLMAANKVADLALAF